MKYADAKAYQDRWKIVGEIEAREQRMATIPQRWKQLNSILGLAIGLGLQLESDEDKLIVYQRWAKIKQAN